MSGSHQVNDETPEEKEELGLEKCHMLNLALKASSVIFSTPSLSALAFLLEPELGLSVIRYFVSLFISPRTKPLSLRIFSNCFLGILKEPVTATLILELFENSS